MALSKQQRWQEDKRRRGLCITCGGERGLGCTKNYCVSCKIARRASARAYKKGLAVKRYRQEAHQPRGRGVKCSRCLLNMRNPIHEEA